MLRCSESKSRGTRLHMLFRNLNVMLVTHIRRNIRRNSYTMAAKIRYSKMVKTCKNMFHMIAQHESWNHDIFGRVPRDYVRFHFLGFCISWPDLNLSSSQLISAHLSSKYHEFQWNLEFWCGHVQMDHHGSEDICLKRFRVTFGWNQPEFLCFCAIEIDRSAEEPSKFTDFWIYADTQKKHNKWSTVI